MVDEKGKMMYSSSLLILIVTDDNMLCYRVNTVTVTGNTATTSADDFAPDTILYCGCYTTR